MDAREQMKVNAGFVKSTTPAGNEFYLKDKGKDIGLLGRYSYIIHMGFGMDVTSNESTLEEVYKYVDMSAKNSLPEIA